VKRSDVMEKKSLEVRVRSMLPAMLALAFTMSGCRAITAIFKAGVLAGLIAVVLVAALVVGVLRLLRRPA
jgi:hypothetical protein